MCKYCKHNGLKRKEFKKELYNNDIDAEPILDVANIGIYINGNCLVGIYFHDGVGIEQDELEISCCPVCKEIFNTTA